MEQKKSFKNYIQFWSFFSLISMSLLIILIELLFMFEEFNIRSAKIRQTYISNQKGMIKKEVDNIVKMIDYEKNQSQKNIRKIVKSRVYEAYNTLENLYLQYKDQYDESVVKKIIVSALDPISFYNGQGYYFIIDTSFENTNKDTFCPPDSLKQYLLGINKESINTFNSDTKKHLSSIISTITDNLKGLSEDYICYVWPKPDNPQKNCHKISYVKRFEPYNWIIGSGLYIDDLEEDSKKEIIQKVTEHRFGKNNNGYVFIYKIINPRGGDNFAIMFANPNRPDLVGKPISDDLKDDLGKEFRKEFIAKLQYQDSCFVDYWYKKFDNTDPSPKTSYFKYSADKNYIVAAGVYLDDIEIEIQDIFSQMENQLKRKSVFIILITIIVFLIFYFFHKKLTKGLKGDFEIFVSFLENAASSGIKIDRYQIKFSEMDRIAVYANQMIDQKNHLDNQIIEKKKNLKEAREYIVNVINSMPLIFWFQKI